MAVAASDAGVALCSNRKVCPFTQDLLAQAGALVRWVRGAATGSRPQSGAHHGVQQEEDEDEVEEARGLRRQTHRIVRDARPAPVARPRRAKSDAGLKVHDTKPDPAAQVVALCAGFTSCMVPNGH